MIDRTKTNSTFASAVAHHDAGRLAEAERSFRAVLKELPAHPVATHLLGLICAKTGRIAEGLELIKRSISYRPNDADFQRNLGLTYRIAGQTEEACGVFRASLALRMDATVLIDLVNALNDLRQHAQAETYARQAVQIAPKSPDAHIALGSVLMALQRIDEAIGVFQTAVSLNTNSGEAYKRLGMALYHRGRFPKAHDILELANRLVPGDPELLNQIGLTLQKLSRRHEARAWFEKVLSMNLMGVDGLFHTANALECLDRLEEAIDLFKKALAINPDLWNAALANSMVRLGRTDEAMELFRQAVERYPNYPLAHLNYGLTLLLKGQYEQGWAEYDWRWHCPTQHEDPRNYPQPKWKDQNIADKRVLLYAEQGLGDTLLMVRYLPMVLERGPEKVILECQGALVALFTRSFPRVQIVRSTETLPEFDLHAALFDMPLIFKTTLETVPAPIPYLVPDPEKVAAWHARLGATSKVGLVWAGSASNPGDRDRSMPLSAMAPLATVSGVRFISLQKGPPSEQLANPPAGLNIEDYTADISNFDDTAALIECLDLVIAVDTSVAHLSGGLGKPTWIPLPYSWFWLYLEKRHDTPWYPRSRLFRQSVRRDWTDPMNRIATELKQWAQAYDGT